MDGNTRADNSVSIRLVEGNYYSRRNTQARGVRSNVLGDLLGPWVHLAGANDPTRIVNIVGSPPPELAAQEFSSPDRNLQKTELTVELDG